VTMLTTTGPGASAPIEVAFGAPKDQNRVTVLFRLILVIPQLIVVALVGLAAAVVLVISWFAALFTGTVPEGCAEFLSGFLRWLARVDAYLFLLTDEYPPFSLDSSPDYPVDVRVETGPHNRWAVLFRYFLAIPASIAATVLLVGLSVFSVVMWVVVLVRGALPEWMFAAAAAAIRYYVRFEGYFSLLTTFQPSGVMGDGGPAFSGPTLSGPTPWPSGAPPSPYGAPPAPYAAPPSPYGAPPPPGVPPPPPGVPPPGVPPPAASAPPPPPPPGVPPPPLASWGTEPLSNFPAAGSPLPPPPLASPPAAVPNLGGVPPVPAPVAADPMPLPSLEIPPPPSAANLPPPPPASSPESTLSTLPPPPPVVESTLPTLPPPPFPQATPPIPPGAATTSPPPPQSAPLESLSSLPPPPPTDLLPAPDLPPPPLAVPPPPTSPYSMHTGPTVQSPLPSFDAPAFDPPSPTPTHAPAFGPASIPGLPPLAPPEQPTPSVGASAVFPGSGPGAPPPPPPSMPPPPQWDASPSAGPDDRWRLILSEPAKRLVVVFFVLGGLAYVVEFMFPALSGANGAANAAAADNRTASAYATLEQQARTFDAQLTNCRSLRSSAALLQCFESNDAHLASDLQSYSNAVSSIDYPSDVSADVAQVQTAVGQASATLTRLSQVGSDVNSYLSAADSSNIVSELGNVTTATSQLESALGSQAITTAFPATQP
jgi:Domain of unknown function (DUF4389)